MGALFLAFNLKSELSIRRLSMSGYPSQTRSFRSCDSIFWGSHCPSSTGKRPMKPSLASCAGYLILPLIFETFVYKDEAYLKRFRSNQHFVSFICILNPIGMLWVKIHLNMRPTLHPIHLLQSPALKVLFFSPDLTFPIPQKVPSGAGDEAKMQN